MNTKNRQLIESIENAIGDYAWEVYSDGTHNVTWHENTATTHTKLQALLLELKKALP